MRRSPRKTKSHERDYVRIPIKNSRVTLLGDIKKRKDGQTVFTGVADGLSPENGHILYRHHEISGYANKGGHIWLKDLIFKQITTYGDSTLGAVKVFARTMYAGDFDPRTEPIHAATMDLPTSIWLSDRRIKEQRVDHSTKSMVIVAPIRVDPIELHSDEHASIKINHLSSFAEHIDYRETVSVDFKQAGTSEEADLRLDALCLLVSVLTQARCWPVKRIYWKDENYDQRAERYSWVDKQAPTELFNWLALPGRIITVLRQMLPVWITAMRHPHTGMLIRKFVNAANNKGYVEADFLAICQCFEGLSVNRIGHQSEVPGCDSKTLSRINDTAKDLGLNTVIRRRVRKAFEDATRLTLEERLKKALVATPFCIQEIMRRRPNIYTEIARRRNQLSHGSTEGVVQSQTDFERLLTETAVIRALSLAEILRLGGLPEQKVAEMVNQDIVMKYLPRGAP
jgi:hypothetical protein